MIIRKLRLQKGWSQEHLSEISGLSSRTIQRIERGHKASLESINALASVFEVDINELQQEQKMTNDTDIKPPLQISEDEKEAIAYVKEIKGFYSDLMSFLVIVPALFILNYSTSPNYIWAWWVLFGWGIGLSIHALTAFEFFNMLSPDWEKKQIEKRLGRKL